MIIINKFLAATTILLNLYFIPITFITIKDQGGPMGYGLYSLPFTSIINLLIIPAIFTFRKMYGKNIALLVINFVGFCLAIFLFALLVSTPRME